MTLGETPEEGPQLVWRSVLPEFRDDPELWEELRRRHDMPDHRSGALYDLGDDLRLAVEVALVTGRPLLMRGEPGSGKSSLAAYVARNLNWCYYEKVVTSATRAEDFLWSFDAVRRLSDAQARQREDPPLDLYDYVEPGVLWWVLDSESARLRGRDSERDWPEAKQATQPLFEHMNRNRNPGHAVVLIDELDKADPDVPNGLLVPLGSGQFRVTETGSRVNAHAYKPETTAAAGSGNESNVGRLLVVITTNEERQLPPAFVRRCVVHSIPPPSREKLIAIARLHIEGPAAASEPTDPNPLYGAVADRVLSIRAELTGHERKPSIAEYLDAVKACLDFGIKPEDDSWVWKGIERVSLIKKKPEPDADM